MTRCDTYTGFPVGAAAAVTIADVDFEDATTLDASLELVGDVSLEDVAFVAGAATAKAFSLTILAKISNAEAEGEAEAEVEAEALEVMVLFTDTTVDVF
ncbi:hypothetical protein BPOR_0270g00030 [Botrytis porri]|uniref:Uncharacterized protein n=1 Tax=Botrytis porri TaxID=87229 RepID=A0A4Z1KT33_9HELO|nr:hypothetical protein BPOR_0270g00030 [Botrytis porri]